MIESILPAGVVAVDCFEDAPDVALFPEEAEAIRGSVEKRRAEYATARHCARRAMAELGIAAVPILSGPRREPLWPLGIVGSMTHCAGYRAAALAHSSQCPTIGIDAEPHEQLPGGVLDAIVRPDEIPLLAALADAYPDVHWDRLTFSAKESVYKAWYPIMQRWLGFEEAALAFDPDARTFAVTLHQSTPGPAPTFAGRWLVQDGLVVTAVSLASQVFQV